MRYPFGKDFQHWFIPLDTDGNPLAVSTAVQAQTPLIHIFKDQPTVAQQQSGATAIQTITTWTWDMSRNGWSYPVDGIADPNPGTGRVIETYWAAVNLFLDVGEDVQPVLTSFELERVWAHTVPLDVDETDLQAYFPQITSYTKEGERLAFIRNAVDHVRASLKSKRFGWVRLNRPDELKRLVCYRALAMLFLSQYDGRNERFWKLHEQYLGFFEIEMAALEIPVDLDGDGKPDAEVKPQSGTILFMR